MTNQEKIAVLSDYIALKHESAQHAISRYAYTELQALAADVIVVQAWRAELTDELARENGDK